jgi:membrane protease YdiL (CAAX protease family)
VADPTTTATQDGLRGPLLPRQGARLVLALEFTALYVAVPIGLWFARERFAGMIVPTLLGLAVVFTAILLTDRSFDRRQLWNARAFGTGLRRILRILVPSAAVVTALTWWFEPELFFRFPRENPRVWIVVMLAYPLLSVYPQELIFRTYLFHRYRGLFGSDRALVAASAVAFGLAHLFFANWWAPLLSTAGGWLFARTYLRTRSTLQATVEHGLWGDVVFTVGLGWYFYGGSIVAQ